MKVIVRNGTLPLEEIEAYKKHASEKYPDCWKLVITLDGEFVDLEMHVGNPEPFERIRRITGYLVGSVDRFNNAKREEVKHRVKHTVGVDFNEEE